MNMILYFKMIFRSKILKALVAIEQTVARPCLEERSMVAEREPKANWAEGRNEKQRCLQKLCEWPLKERNARTRTSSACEDEATTNLSAEVVRKEQDDEWTAQAFGAVFFWKLWQKA